MIFLQGLGAISDATGGIFDSLLSVTYIAIAALIFLLFMGGIIGYVWYIKKYNILVMVYSQRGSGGETNARKGENYRLFFDKAAILHDRKNGYWYFKLKTEKWELPVPKFELLEKTNRGNLLKIYQFGNEDYMYLTTDNVNLKYVITEGNRKIPIGQVENNIIDANTAAWGQIKKRSNRKLFDTEAMIYKILPYISLLLVGIFILFLVWIVLDKFSVIQGVADSLNKAAETLARANSGQAITVE